MGWLLALIGTVCSILNYIKAPSMVPDLDAVRPGLAVFAPLFALVLLDTFLGLLITLWLVILR